MGSNKDNRPNQLLLSKLKELTTDNKAYLIMHLIGMDLREWDEVNSSRVKCIYKTAQEAHSQYINDQAYNKAYKIGMEHMHQLKMMELYNLYFEKAKTDTNAFKAFIDFSEKWFKDGKQDSDLISILSGVDLEDEEDA